MHHFINVSDFKVISKNYVIYSEKLLWGELNKALYYIVSYCVVLYCIVVRTSISHTTTLSQRPFENVTTFGTFSCEPTGIVVNQLVYIHSSLT